MIALATIAAAFACSTGTEHRPLATAARTQALATADQIPGEYIVVYKNGVDVAAAAAKARGRVRHKFGSVLNGYSTKLTDEALAAALSDPDVAYVTPNTVARVNTASWGLDRIDQRELPLDGAFSPPGSGAGVDIYVVDTGVRISHDDFGGRARYADSPENGDFVGDKGNADDCNGHGTHVAGTSAGTTYGVAKGANIIGVRVLSCAGSGSYDGIIAALDWIAANAEGPSVVNMSLGGSQNQALDDAIANLTTAGVTVAVAAGNDDNDACGHSPAAAPSAITVGATNADDGEASFSNVGTCVDILAPGRDITSAWYSHDTATQTISGTSMASPHAAGAAALYLGENPTASPDEVANALLTSATWNAITMKSNSGNTANALVFVEFDEGGWVPSCEIAKNGKHRRKKRAERIEVNGVTSFYALGSGDYMGQAWKTVTTLKASSDDVWRVVDSCSTPPPPADNSCEGRCDTQAPAGCWCDNVCTSFGDCCDDYSQVCPALPIFPDCETETNKNHRLMARAYRKRVEGKMRFFAAGDDGLLGRGKAETSLAKDPEVGWTRVNDCADLPPLP